MKHLILVLALILPLQGCELVLSPLELVFDKESSYTRSPIEVHTRHAKKRCALRETKDTPAFTECVALHLEWDRERGLLHTKEKL